MEDEKRALAAVSALVDQPHRREKHRASKSAKVNPFSITLAKDAPILVEGLVLQGSSSAQITVADTAPTGIPLSRKSKGVAMSVVKEEDQNMYKDSKDSEIDVLFKESDLLQATGDVSHSPHVK